MYRHPLLQSIAISLCAVLPVCVFGTEREAWTEAVVAHERLQAADLFLGEVPDKSIEYAIERNCSKLDRQCVLYSQEQPDRLMAVIPDNPEFWEALSAAMQADPLPAEYLKPNKAPDYTGFLAGTKAWIRRELSTNQITDPERLQEQVAAHRRRLASSTLLIDKMIFTATTGILLPAINVYMADRGTAGGDGNKALLDDMLEQLSRDELSLRLALNGEIRLANGGIEPLSYEAGFIDELGRLYAYVSDRSEADWDDFWSTGVDIHQGVPGLLLEDVWLPDFADYSASIRYLDAKLYVLRALREVYEGRESAGMPSQSPPAGWYWIWLEESQTLCLEPGNPHYTLSQTASICADYLDSPVLSTASRSNKTHTSSAP